MIDLIDWIMKLDHNYDVLHYFPLIGTSSAPSMARDCDQEMTLECKKEMQNATNRKYKKMHIILFAFLPTSICSMPRLIAGKMQAVSFGSLQIYAKCESEKISAR